MPLPAVTLPAVTLPRASQIVLDGSPAVPPETVDQAVTAIRAADAARDAAIAVAKAEADQALSVANQALSGSTSVASTDSGALLVDAYGAKGDGVMHTVSDWIGSGEILPGWSKYANFSALQADNPWVTDTGYGVDSAAFNRAVRAVKASNKQGALPELNGSPPLMFAGGRKYMLNHPVFVGCDRDGPSQNYPLAFVMEVIGNNARLHFAMADTSKVGLDLSGVRFGHYHDFTVSGDASAPPRVGILAARGGLVNPSDPTTGRSADDFCLRAVRVGGSFGLCCYYEYACEDVLLDFCYFRPSGGGAKACVILTNANQENVPLDFQTDAPAGDQTTYVGGKLNKCYLYYDVPTGMPSDAATLIVWGSARHKLADVFFSQAAGQGQIDADGGRDHIAIRGTDPTHAPGSQFYDGCHFHAACRHNVRVQIGMTGFSLRDTFESSQKVGSTVELDNNVAIADAGAVEGTVFHGTGASGGFFRARDFTVRGTSGSVNLGGTLSGLVKLASGTTLAAALKGFFQVNTASGVGNLNGLNAFAMAFVPLSGTTPQPSFSSAGKMYTLTTIGDTLFVNPAALQVGQWCLIEVTNDTGTRVVTFGTGYVHAGANQWPAAPGSGGAGQKCTGLYYCDLLGKIVCLGVSGYR